MEKRRRRRCSAPPSAWARCWGGPPSRRRDSRLSAPSSADSCRSATTFRTPWRRRPGRLGPPFDNLPILYAMTADHPLREMFLDLSARSDDPEALAEAQKILIRSGAVSYCAFKMIELSQEAREPSRVSRCATPDPSRGSRRPSAAAPQSPGVGRSGKAGVARGGDEDAMDLPAPGPTASDPSGRLSAGRAQPREPGIPGALYPSPWRAVSSVSTVRPGSREANVPTAISLRGVPRLPSKPGGAHRAGPRPPLSAVDALEDYPVNYGGVLPSTGGCPCLFVISIRSWYPGRKRALC